MITRPRTVLIVGNDPFRLDFISRVIGTRYPVARAAGEDDTIRITRNVMPSLIVLDITMSGKKDGFSTFVELKKNEETRRIPVLILSELERIRALALGPDSMESRCGYAPKAFAEKSASAAVMLAKVVQAIEGDEAEPSERFAVPVGTVTDWQRRPRGVIPAWVEARQYAAHWSEHDCVGNY